MSTATMTCACPNCHSLCNVPSDSSGKYGICPSCRARFRIREAGGKTILELAGVDGHAPTTLAPPPAKPFTLPPNLSVLLNIGIWFSCAALVLVEIMRFLMRPTWREAIRALPAGREDPYIAEAFDGVLGPMGMTIMAYIMARCLTSLIDLCFTKSVDGKNR